MLYPAFYGSSFITEYRGSRRQLERYVKLKFQKTASFILVESLDVPPEHTHLHSPERFEWMTFSCLSFMTRQNSVRPVSPDCSVEADWLKCATPPNKVTLLARRHPFCYTIRASSSSCCTSAPKVAKRSAQGWNSQSE